jgi:DNA-binding MarR family transcriptional regulator
MGPKSKELSTETKELIVKLHRKKERRSYISDLLDIPWSTIDRNIDQLEQYKIHDEKGSENFPG